MRPQPPLGSDKQQVLQKKILKFINKEYIAPPKGRINSLIKNTLLYQKES
jgi:hypothetical protein